MYRVKLVVEETQHPGVETQHPGAIPFPAADTSSVVYHTGHANSNTTVSAPAREGWTTRLAVGGAKKVVLFASETLT